MRVSNLQVSEHSMRSALCVQGASVHCLLFAVCISCGQYPISVQRVCS
jgi:hypothetical protein